MSLPPLIRHNHHNCGKVRIFRNLNSRHNPNLRSWLYEAIPGEVTPLDNVGKRYQCTSCPSIHKTQSLILPAPDFTSKLSESDLLPAAAAHTYTYDLRFHTHDSCLSPFLCSCVCSVSILHLQLFFIKTTEKQRFVARGCKIPFHSGPHGNRSETRLILSTFYILHSVIVGFSNSLMINN